MLMKASGRTSLHVVRFLGLFSLNDCYITQLLYCVSTASKHFEGSRSNLACLQGLMQSRLVKLVDAEKAQKIEYS